MIKVHLLQNFDELDDVGVRAQPPQRLNFFQVVYLIDGVKVALHAFYGDVPPRLDALCFQHLREGTFSYFAY